MIEKRVRSGILEKYDVSESDLIGQGTEALVYRCREGRVLKLYNSISDCDKQRTLKRFYEAIDSGDVGYELPRIYDITEDSGIVVTIEKRIEGYNLQNLLPRLNHEQLDDLFQTYLSASLELRKVRTNSAFTGCKLFSDDCAHLSGEKEWHSFLRQFLICRQEGLRDSFSKDVLNYHGKLAALSDILSAKYKGGYSLIHGDFYPGNLLVNEDGRITGLIDFGIMTMCGDYLFDIATGWAFFDMYDELKADVLERYLHVITERLGEGITGRLSLYLLVFSMVAANFYSKECDDGHYRWCVRNLNNEAYWNGLS